MCERAGVCACGSSEGSSSQCINIVHGQWWQQWAKAANSSGSSSGRPSSEVQSEGCGGDSRGSSKAKGRGLVVGGAL